VINCERFYLDYNATSPFAKSVIDYLAKGDLLFANPSSAHQTGKTTQKKIDSVKTFLFKFFHMKQEDYKILFHSGASEGFQSFCHQMRSGDLFFFSKADHAMVLNAIGSLNDMGIKCVEVPLDEKGQYDLSGIKTQLESHTQKAFWNYTWINSETGIINDLVHLKEFENIINIHIDAVQSPGKTADYKNIPVRTSMITYSGHKFGALNGIGFSFIHNSFDYRSLIQGGGQQDGLRGGTLNALGILSLQLALEEMNKNNYFDKITLLRDGLVEVLKNCLGNKVRIIEGHMANNTICFAIENKKADEVFMHFDLAGVDISMGSACSSQSSRPSETLLAMGLTSEADCYVRASIGYMDDQEYTELKKVIKTTLENLI
jgi:cysteine desulfurase